MLYPAEPPAAGPSPVVLFLGAANVPPECYSWLATRLCAAGYAAVLCSAVLRYGPEAALLPLPYDVGALSDWAAYKRGPALEGARLVVGELHKLNDARAGPLFRALDMNTLVLGVRCVGAAWFLCACLLLTSAYAQGHSTGGRAALELVAFDADSMPEVAGCFAYGATLDNEPRRAHLERPSAPPGTLRPFQRFCPPLLLLGGDADASLAAEVEGADAGGDNGGDAMPSPAFESVSGLRRLLWPTMNPWSRPAPSQWSVHHTG